MEDRILHGFSSRLWIGNPFSSKLGLNLDLITLVKIAHLVVSATTQVIDKFA